MHVKQFLRIWKDQPVPNHNNRQQRANPVHIFVEHIVNQNWWHPQYKWSCTCDMCLYFLLRWSSVWQWFVLYLPMSLCPWTHLWWKYGGMSWRLWWWKQDWQLVQRYMDWPWMSVWWVITPSKNLYHRALSLKKTNPQHKKLQDCGYNIEVG